MPAGSAAGGTGGRHTGVPRVRRVPQRTCVGCGEVHGKRELLRIVRTPQGELALDPTGKRNGRGAYVHRDEACWQRALGPRLARALRLDPQAAEAQWPALRAAFQQLMAAPVPRKPMVHRAPVPLPPHLIARGRRGPTRTPSRRRSAAAGEAQRRTDPADAPAWDAAASERSACDRAEARGGHRPPGTPR